MIASTWGLIGAAVGLGFGLFANLVMLPMFERTAAERAAKATGADSGKLARQARIVRILFRSELVVLPVFFYYAFSTIEA
jgi:hypothetical protein